MLVALFVAFGAAAFALAQTADESALKSVIRAETSAFYGRDAAGWEATWLHDANATRTLVVSNSYSSAKGWDKIRDEVVKSIEASPKPIPGEFTNDNYVIRTDDRLAWVEYDQTLTLPTIDPKLKRISREYRVLVKADGQWKIASQITHDPQTFGSSPEAIEGTLNQTGYHLLKAGKVQEAIELFKLNVRFYPESWNVYDSLGEAYAAAGSKELAIENYEKSLKLNPRNEGAKAALAKLKQK